MSNKKIGILLVFPQKICIIESRRIVPVENNIIRTHAHASLIFVKNKNPQS